MQLFRYKSACDRRAHRQTHKHKPTTNTILAVARVKMVELFWRTELIWSKLSLPVFINEAIRRLCYSGHRCQNCYSSIAVSVMHRCPSSLHTAVSCYSNLRLNVFALFNQDSSMTWAAGRQLTDSLPAA